MTKELDSWFEALNIPKVNTRQYSPLVLAFMGDSIYDLIIRTKVVAKANAPVNKLHSECRTYVKASAQAVIVKGIMDKLTDEEVAVFKRGRNAKSASVPKNANLMDYKNATGFEALLGYLYLEGRMERIFEIINFGIEGLEQDTTEE
ncbi:Mini-ribonuclease 3 [Vallitalea okinawensis]|uniref:Mini-ribonuclease 3 n=1 Tax=Vallitalea okinawensis TaxID=2078660 RepID=UPI000CFB4AE7|nr:ribonuclease III domain-containing protein [Vallitalea okinawensis]